MPIPVPPARRALVAAASLLLAVAAPSAALDLATLPANTWIMSAPTYAGAPDGGSYMPQAWNNKAVYDPVSHRVVILDRWNDPVRNGSIYANALLAFDPAAELVSVLKLGNWTVQAVGATYQTVALPAQATDPTPVDRHPLGGLAYDADTGEIVVSGGLNQSAAYDGVFGTAITDSWAYGVAAGTWTKLTDESSTPPNPPSYVGQVLVYDAARRALVYFYPKSSGGTQTWVLDRASRVWTAQPDDASAAAVSVAGAGGAYDARRARIVVFGGGWDQSAASAHLWAYSLADNRWTALADCPEAAPGPAFDYDANHDVFLALNDQHTWVYDPVADAWSAIAAPITRIGDHWAQPIAYDVAHDVFVFAGGNGGYGPAQWALFRYAARDAAPTFLREPADATIAAGGDAVFTALAAGSPAPSLRWQAAPRGGAFADLPGATSTTLTRAAVGAGDDGSTFRCIATNADGSATSAVATLSVAGGGTTSGGGTTAAGTTSAGTTTAGTTTGGTTAGTTGGTGSTSGGTTSGTTTSGATTSGTTATGGTTTAGTSTIGPTSHGGGRRGCGAGAAAVAIGVAIASLLRALRVGRGSGRALLVALALLAGGELHAAVSTPVPLVIEEAIYPGVGGVDRTQDPVTVGVPLPDAWNVTSTAQLGLSGAAAGQFRVLGRWPSGNVEWVLVDTLADCPAGGQQRGIALTAGSGDFGGAPLATDDGAVITVATGAATFTVRKAGFDGLDSAVVGGRTIIAAGSSLGLVLTGPAPGQTTPPCTTLYASANDPASTATIEENGPVKTVVRAVGSHVDGAGHIYLHYTARLTFWRNERRVKVTTVLRNADHGGANEFATAYKAVQAYELRLGANLATPLSYAIATDAAPIAGTLAGSASATIYQGQSHALVWDDCLPGSACSNYFTTDTGFTVAQDATTLATGTAEQAPRGWAEIHDGGGAGVSIGVYQFAAYWPKSLEFDGGGRDVRIGILPRENSQPVWQAWPAWSIHDCYVEVHAAAPASVGDDFARFEHPLIAHADRAHYNASGVFPFAMPSAAQEDAFYTDVTARANPALDPARGCCVQDLGTVTAAFPLSIYRSFTWSQGGAGTQEEFRWSNLQAFIKRDHTGRYLNSMHFYRFLAEKGWPHADGVDATDATVDGFHWRDRPHYNQPGGEVNLLGQPYISHQGDPSGQLDNSDKALLGWFETYHGHWYGMTDWYFMSGDETAREAMLCLKDYYLNDDSVRGSLVGGGLGAARAVGIELLSASRLGEFLRATGDADAAGCIAQAALTYDTYIRPEPCISGYPAGCTPPPILNYGPTGWDQPGVSRERGYPLGTANRGLNWCPSDGSGANNYERGMSAFQAAILEEGILALRRAEGPAWPRAQEAIDLAYGISQWALGEAYADDGSGTWFDAAHASGSHAASTGFRYGIIADLPQVCPPATPLTTDGNGTFAIDGKVWDAETLAGPDETVWMHFYVQWLVTGLGPWRDKLEHAVQWVAAGQGITADDFGAYQIANVVEALDSDDPTTLVPVATSSFHDDGGGAYTVAWTVPTGARSYVIRWGERAVVESLQFDPLESNAFAIDPATHQTWWTAHVLANPPAPLGAGATQTLTLSGLPSGLAAANVVVKAWVPTGSAPRAPLRTDGAPLGTLPSGTTATTLSLATDIDAGCRYADQPDVPYGSMTHSFTSVDHRHQLADVGGLVDAHSYLWYVRCSSDADGAANQDDAVIGFTIGAVASGGGTATGGSSTAGATSGGTTTAGATTAGGAGSRSSGHHGGCGAGAGIVAIGVSLLSALRRWRGAARRGR